MRRRTSPSPAVSGRRIREPVRPHGGKLTEPELLPGDRARRPLDTLRCCRGYQVLSRPGKVLAHLPVQVLLRHL
jgi:hypothetical protein